MDLSTEKIDRAIYGTLDWLGDIGGFNEALTWLAMALIYFLQF